MSFDINYYNKSYLQFLENLEKIPHKRLRYYNDHIVSNYLLSRNLLYWTGYHYSFYSYYRILYFTCYMKWKKFSKYNMFYAYLILLLLFKQRSKIEFLNKHRKVKYYKYMNQSLNHGNLQTRLTMSTDMFFEFIDILVANYLPKLIKTPLTLHQIELNMFEIRLTNVLTFLELEQFFETPQERLLLENNGILSIQFFFYFSDLESVKSMKYNKPEYTEKKNVKNLADFVLEYLRFLRLPVELKLDDNYLAFYRLNE